MITSREDINDLFTTFHDFVIKNIKHGREVLIITIDTPFEEDLGLSEYIIKLHLYGCRNVSCKYRDKKGTSASTDSCDQITNLALNIQGYKFYAPREYEFFCDTNLNPEIEEGQIRFDADAAELFDSYDNPLSLDKIKELAIMRWENIQRMWDEQSNKDVSGDS